jgi:hypothetical protein
MTNVPRSTKAEDLLVFRDPIEAGRDTLVIGARYPLIAHPNAIRALGTGHGRGKVVMTV